MRQDPVGQLQERIRRAQGLIDLLLDHGTTSPEHVRKQLRRMYAALEGTETDGYFAYADTNERNPR